MRMLYRLSRPAATLAALMLLPLTAVSAVLAQTGTAVKSRPSAAFPVPPTRADRPPYTSWTKHLCTASDAVVSVQATVRRQNTGENVVQKGTGVLIRCDGLVLIPSAILHLAPGPNETEARNRTRIVDITILLPESLDEKGEAVRVSVPEPRFSTREVPYVVVKIRDRHLRGVPLIYPGAVEGERRVQVLFPGNTASEVDANQGRGELVRVTGRVRRRGDSANASCDLVLDNSATAPKLPVGAVVMDTDSGMALGMIAPGWGIEPSVASFTTFGSLHEVTNSVGMVTRPDARIAEERADKVPAAGTKQGEMIWIPGGAAAVDPVDFPDGNGAVVACTPGYWIDETEVTVGEYRAFLKATGHRPLPVRWQEGDVLGGKNAHFQDDLPIHGVTSVDAEAYARWAGKRLATPLEWRRAARGVGFSPIGPLPQSSNAATPGKYQTLSERGSIRYFMQGGLFPFPLPSLEGIATPIDTWPTAYEAALSVTEARLRYVMLDCLLIEAKQWDWITYGQGSNIDRPIVTPGRGTRAPVPIRSNKIPYQGVWSQLTPSQAVLSPPPGDSGMMYGVIMLRHRTMERVQEFFQNIFGCIALSPAGANTYDRSLFGVLDMGIGVSELLQANQAYRKTEQVDKLIRPLFDPEVTPEWRDTWHEEIARRVAAYDVRLSGSDNYNYTNAASYVVWLPGSERTMDRAEPDGVKLATSVLRLRTDVPATMQRLGAYPAPLLPILPLSKMSEAPDLGAGFRCVR